MTQIECKTPKPSIKHPSAMILPIKKDKKRIMALSVFLSYFCKNVSHIMVFSLI